jgi:hypothetical protein
MAGEIPVIPPDTQKVYRRLKRWRITHTGRLSIPERGRSSATPRLSIPSAFARPHVTL